MQAQKVKLGNPMKKRILRNSMVTLARMIISYAARGLAYGFLQDYDHGFSDLDTALIFNPDNGWAVFFKGNLEEAQAHREAAQENQAEVHEEIAPSELETMLNN